MSIILFFAVLFVLVLVHELGHFAVAKWTGMRVDEFGIGFPPKLFSIKKGETEYTFNLLPLGGFVKIFGEDSIGVANNPAENRSFTSKNRWAQTAVLVAGVAMNVLFAWVLMTIVFMVGVNTSVSESDASPSARLIVTDVLEGSPAESVSLEHGSMIIGLQNEETKLDYITPSAFSNFIATHANQELTLTYQVGEELRIAQITPQSGLVEGDDTRPAIGVALSLVDVVKQPLPSAVVESFVFVWTGIHDITVGISVLLYDAIKFQADFSQIAGPVGIVGLVGEASQYGLTSLLMFTAFISLNLAVINILPFPALDGGRLLIVGIEAVRRKPIKPEFVGALNAIGFFLLIFLMVAVTWNDIMRLV